MRLTVTARTRLDPALRTYAVEKLGKLDRHDDSIHEARVVLEDDERRLPRASAEVFVHLRHTQLMARCEGSTVQEAIDKVADKIDRQILRRKEKVKEHKGRPAAGSDPQAPAPRRVAPANGARSAAATAASAPLVAADPVAVRREVLLRPMSLDDAIVVFEKGAEPFLLYIDDEGGELCLLTRRSDGELELVVGDTR
jgi:putative sigma-54 modulation protein